MIYQGSLVTSCLVRLKQKAASISMLTEDKHVIHITVNHILLLFLLLLLLLHVS